MKNQMRLVLYIRNAYGGLRISFASFETRVTFIYRFYYIFVKYFWGFDLIQSFFVKKKCPISTFFGQNGTN